MITFEIRERSQYGRIGQIEVRGRKFETPILLPVVNPNINTIPPREIGDVFHFDGIITNSYIIYKKPELRERALTEGLHRMMDFDGFIMTDSGTFQSYVYGDVPVENSEIVSFQRDMGSDVGTILDIFTRPDDSRQRVSEAIKETMSRLREALEIRGDMALAAPVQGGIYPELREKAAKLMTAVDVEYHPIGGVVPLMESYRYTELVDIILRVQRHINPSRPVHLFGAGHPMIIPLAVAMGIDVFDSALYAKYAKDDRIITLDGTYRLREIDHLPCTCPVCSKFSSPADILELPKNERIAVLARHNLWVTRMAMEEAKMHLREGTIMELVEERARSHPALLEATRYFISHKGLIRHRWAPSGSRIFYLGDISARREEIAQLREKLLHNYVPPSPDVVIIQSGRPYWTDMKHIYHQHGSTEYGVIVSDPIIGAVPFELSEMFPVGQIISPAKKWIDPTTRMAAKRHLKRFMSIHGLKEIELPQFGVKKEESTKIWHTRYIRAMVDFLCGPGAWDEIFRGNVDFVLSKRTGRIRNVLMDGEHIFSVDASRGTLIIKPPGAMMALRKGRPFPGVIVSDDSAEYNAQGRNVFYRFITGIVGTFQPNQDIVVYDRDGVVATGRAMASSREMRYFNTGVAVKVREGVGSK